MLINVSDLARKSIGSVYCPPSTVTRRNPLCRVPARIQQLLPTEVDRFCWPCTVANTADHPAFLRGRLTEPGYLGPLGCRIFCQPVSVAGCAMLALCLVLLSGCGSYVTKEELPELIENHMESYKLKSFLVHGIAAREIVAEKIIVKNPDYDDAEIVLEMDEGNPVLILWKGPREEARAGYAGMRVSKEVVDLMAKNRDGPFCILKAKPEYAAIKAQADIFVGKKGHSVSLQATELKARLFARNRNGDRSFP